MIKMSISELNFETVCLNNLIRDPLFIKLEEALDSICPPNNTIQRNDIRRWARLHYCVEVAILFSYPLAKLLYGNQMKWKLLIGKDHIVIVGLNKNNNKYIFDPISYVYKINVEWSTEDIFVEENDIGEWYCVNLLNGVFNKVLDDLEELLVW